MQKKKLKRKEVKQILLALHKRFGISPEIFKGLALFKTKDRVYITTAECSYDSLFSAVETAGLALIRQGNTMKPTTDALQLFGEHATKNSIELSREELEKAIKGESIIKEFKNEIPENLTNGYIIMKYKKHVLGCGFLRDGIVESMIPKPRRALLRGVKSY